MRSVRLTLAAIAATALLVVASGSPAGAQSASDVSVEYACNDATGEYEFTFVLENFLDEEADISAQYSYDTASGGTGGAVLEFSPDPIGAGGTSIAVAATPGDTDLFEAFITLEYIEFDDDHEITIEIGEECVPTTTTTSEPTTTTTAETAGTVQPRFTG